MKYFAPISIGNFSVGFDLLGLAVTPKNGELLGDIVSIKPADEFMLVTSGSYQDVLPEDSEQNLVTKAYQLFKDAMEKMNQSISPVEILLEKRLPVGSGLGSSASSSVATLYGLNEHYEQPFNVDQLLEMAGELEGQVSGSIHYDNVAPCLLGGLQLMTPNKMQPSIAIPFPENWRVIVSYPGVSVSTKDARESLPKELKLSQSIQFAQNLSVFIHAMHMYDEELAASVLFDVVAEDYRKDLIPGFVEFKDFSKTMGALAFGISGSGSTVFSICNNEDIANKIQKYAVNTFCKNNSGFSYICKVDNYGVRPIREEKI